MIATMVLFISVHCDFMRKCLNSVWFVRVAVDDRCICTDSSQCRNSWLALLSKIADQSYYCAVYLQVVGMGGGGGGSPHHTPAVISGI